MKAVDAPEPGFDARRRLAELEAARDIYDRLLRRASDELADAHRRIAALERRATPAPDQGASRYVPIAEAAARCGLSVQTLKRLVRRGALDGCAVRATGAHRRRWLINANSLEALLSTSGAHG